MVSVHKVNHNPLMGIIFLKNRPVARNSSDIYNDYMYEILIYYTVQYSNFPYRKLLQNHILLIMSAINKIFCSQYSKLFCHQRTKIIAAERNVFYVISYFVKSLMNTCPKDCLRCPGLARHHAFLDGTLSLRCATSRYLMSLKYET